MTSQIITDIQPLEDDPNFRVLFVNDVPQCTIPTTSVELHDIQIGQEWNDELATRVQSEKEIEGATKIALGLIATKAWGVKELATRLEKRGIDHNIAIVTTKQLAEDGWLDDFAYACARIRDWIRKEPASRVWLTHKLQERKLDKETIHRALDEELDGQCEQDAATELAIIRLSKTNDQDERTLRRKVISALSRRGFSTDVGSEAYRRAQAEIA